MSDLPSVPGDFNRLGMNSCGQDEENVIPLGRADLTLRLGMPPENGQAVLVYEFGEMEARGVLRQAHSATGVTVWDVLIDPTTIRLWTDEEVAAAIAEDAASKSVSRLPQPTPPHR